MHTLIRVKPVADEMTYPIPYICPIAYIPDFTSFGRSLSSLKVSKMKPCKWYYFHYALIRMTKS